MAGGSSQRAYPGSVLPADPVWRRALSLALLPFSFLYRMVVRQSRRRWRGRSSKLSVPVISVGNLSCGGTGKTPTVEMVARDLSARGWTPAILSRGYGAGAAQPGEGASGNDEYRVLRENLPEVEHYQGADRVASGREAIEAGADILVLDDGFQHFRIHRDLDLVLLDALRPFDNGRLLPSGLLREPVESLSNADLLAVSRVHLISEERRDSLVGFLEESFPGIPILLFESKPVCWQELGGETLAPDSLAGNEVCAFCGIGNPYSFRLTLELQGLKLAGFQAFRDHGSYDEEAVEKIAAWARENGVDTVVMTQKDAVKIDLDWLEAQEGIRWLFLRIEQSIESGRDAYERTLEGLASGER